MSEKQDDSCIHCPEHSGIVELGRALEQRLNLFRQDWKSDLAGITVPIRVYTQIEEKNKVRIDGVIKMLHDMIEASSRTNEAFRQLSEDEMGFKQTALKEYGDFRQEVRKELDRSKPTVKGALGYGILQMVPTATIMGLMLFFMGRSLDVFSQHLHTLMDEKIKAATLVVGEIEKRVFRLEEHENEGRAR